MNIQDFVTEVDTLYPNSFTDQQKITWLNQVQNRYVKWLTGETLYSFNTVADQEIYTLPDGISFDLVKALYISPSTDTPDSETYFEQYHKAGRDNYLAGKCFYKSLDNIGISPVPDNAYPARMYYQERPTEFSSTDMTAEFNIDTDWIEALIFKVAARCAKTGKFPNVELANNYEAEAEDLLRQMRHQKTIEKTDGTKKRWGWGGYV